MNCLLMQGRTGHRPEWYLLQAPLCSATCGKAKQRCHQRFTGLLGSSLRGSALLSHFSVWTI